MAVLRENLGDPQLQSFDRVITDEGVCRSQHGDILDGPMDCECSGLRDDDPDLLSPGLQVVANLVQHLHHAIVGRHDLDSNIRCPYPVTHGSFAPRCTRTRHESNVGRSHRIRFRAQLETGIASADSAGPLTTGPGEQQEGECGDNRGVIVTRRTVSDELPADEFVPITIVGTVQQIGGRHELCGVADGGPRGVSCACRSDLSEGYPADAPEARISVTRADCISASNSRDTI